MAGVADGLDHSGRLSGPDDVHRRMPRPKPHVLFLPENPAQIGTNNASMTRHYNALSRMGCDDSLDRVHGSLSKFERERLSINIR